MPGIWLIQSQASTMHRFTAGAAERSQPESNDGAGNSAAKRAGRDQCSVAPLLAPDPPRHTGEWEWLLSSGCPIRERSASAPVRIQLDAMAERRVRPRVDDGP